MVSRTEVGVLYLGAIMVAASRGFAEYVLRSLQKRTEPAGKLQKHPDSMVVACLS